MLEITSLPQTVSGDQRRNIMAEAEAEAEDSNDGKLFRLETKSFDVRREGPHIDVKDTRNKYISSAFKKGKNGSGLKIFASFPDKVLPQKKIVQQHGPETPEYEQSRNTFQSEIDAPKSNSLVATLSGNDYDWEFLPGDLLDIFEISAAPTIKPLGGRSFLLTFMNTGELELVLKMEELFLWDTKVTFSCWRPILSTLPSSVMETKDIRGRRSGGTVIQISQYMPEFVQRLEKEDDDVDLHAKVPHKPSNPGQPRVDNPLPHSKSKIIYFSPPINHANPSNRQAQFSEPIIQYSNFESYLIEPLQISDFNFYPHKIISPNLSPQFQSPLLTETQVHSQPVNIALNATLFTLENRFDPLTEVNHKVACKAPNNAWDVLSEDSYDVDINIQEFQPEDSREEEDGTFSDSSSSHSDDGFKHNLIKTGGSYVMVIEAFIDGGYQSVCEGECVDSKGDNGRTKFAVLSGLDGASVRDRHYFGGSGYGYGSGGGSDRRYFGGSGGDYDVCGFHQDGRRSFSLESFRLGKYSVNEE